MTCPCPLCYPSSVDEKSTNTAFLWSKQQNNCSVRDSVKIDGCKNERNISKQDSKCRRLHLFFFGFIQFAVDQRKPCYSLITPCKLIKRNLSLFTFCFVVALSIKFLYNKSQHNCCQSESYSKFLQCVPVQTVRADQ